MPNHQPTFAPTTSTPTPTFSPTVFETCNATIQDVASPRDVKIHSNEALFEPVWNASGRSHTHTLRAAILLTAPGTPIVVQGSWSAFTHQLQIQTPQSAPLSVWVVLVDNDVDEQSRRVRVACQVLGTSLSPRGLVPATQCYVQLVSSGGGGGTAAGSCYPASDSGTCIVTVSQLSDTLLINGDIAVRYGVGLVPQYPFMLGEVTSAHIPAAYINTETLENNYVLHLPSRTLYAGEVFTVRVTVRATETVRIGRFGIDISRATDSLEFLSVSELGPTTWLMASDLGSDAYSFGMQTLTTESCTACPTCQSCYAEQPGDQADQDVVRVRVRVKSSAVAAEALIGLRVYEFGVGSNDRVPPGNQTITDTPRYVAGHIIGGAGSAATRNGGGTLAIAPNLPVGLFARLSDGRGTVVNLATLTGITSATDIIATAFYPYGSVERVVASPSCGPTSWVSATCVVTMAPDTTRGMANVAVGVHGDGAAGTMRLNVLVPGAITVRPDVQSLGTLSLDGQGDGLRTGDSCENQRFTSTRITATTVFSDGVTTTPTVDVTSLVLSQLVSSNEAVVTVDTTAGVATGVGDGTASIGFGPGRVTTITVDCTEVWQLRSVFTRTLTGLSATARRSSGSEIVVQLKLLTASLIRTGAEGLLPQISWAEFVSPEGVMSQLDLSYAPSLTYAPGRPGETIATGNPSSSALGHVEAVSDDDFGTVIARWAPACADTVLETTSCVVVELEEANELRITNGANDGVLSACTLAHSSDAAFLVGVIDKAVQRIGFARVYITYSDEFNDDGAVGSAVFNASLSEHFTIGNSSLIEIVECDWALGSACIVSKRGAFGTTTVSVQSGTLRSEVSVTVVKASGMLLQTLAHPGYTTRDGTVAAIDILRPFGAARTEADTAFEQARLQLIMSLSNRATADISAHSAVTYAVCDDAEIEIFNTRHARVTSVVDGNPSSSNQITATLPGRNGAESDIFTSSVLLGVNRDDNPVRSLSDVRIVDSGNNPLSTLHGVVGDAFQVLFTCEFTDGFVLRSGDMVGSQFPSAFLATLFRFSSNRPTEMSVTTAGQSVIHQNLIGQTAVTVSSVGTTATGVSNLVFVNLKAGNLQIDVASSSSHVSAGQPVVNITTGFELSLQLHLTSSAPIGSLNVRLSFNPNMVEFVGVVSGSDFAGQVDGEELISHPGVISVNIATATSFSGTDQHLATVQLRAIGPGVVQFVGDVTRFYNPDGSEMARSYPVPFGPAGNVATVISDGRRTARSLGGRGRRQVTGCVPGVGQFPRGDVTGDCVFAVNDVQLTMQYLVVKEFPARLAAFVTAKVTTDIFLGNWSSALAAMDVDLNQEVEQVDSFLMMAILSGSSRFLWMPAVECANHGVTPIARLTMRVEQSSSDETYELDPSRASHSHVTVVFTGAIPSDATVASHLQRQFTGNSAMWSSNNGRFIAALPAIVNNVSSGEYGVDVDMANLPGQFGVSQLLLTKKSGQWRATSGGSFFTDATGAEQRENVGGAGMHIAVSTPDDNLVNFSWGQPFAARSVLRVGCSMEPVVAPTTSPTSSSPTSSPTTLPPTTAAPTVSPTTSPSSSRPTASPTALPTRSDPTTSPSTSPTISNPTTSPSLSPTSSAPSASPTFSPTTATPTASPTTSNPTSSPTTSEPTQSPSTSPTFSLPTESPTFSPTTSGPSSSPTTSPSASPTTSEPTTGPSLSPTAAPSMSPTTSAPTVSPSVSPTTSMPTVSPSTSPTTSEPTVSPSVSPTTSDPTTAPTQSPTLGPTTSDPTTAPTTSVPTASPTASPTLSPTTPEPTTSEPTVSPTTFPTTASPTVSPTGSPTLAPTTTDPTRSPTSSLPSVSPTSSPTASPTDSPTCVGPNVWPDDFCRSVFDQDFCCNDEMIGHCDGSCCSVECSHPPTMTPTSLPHQAPAGDLERCNHSKWTDIVFVIDVSTSVRLADWLSMKAFMKRVIEPFLDANRTRVAFVLFSGDRAENQYQHIFPYAADCGPNTQFGALPESRRAYCQCVKVNATCVGINGSACNPAGEEPRPSQINGRRFENLSWYLQDISGHVDRAAGCWGGTSQVIDGHVLGTMPHNMQIVKEFDEPYDPQVVDALELMGGPTRTSLALEGVRTGVLQNSADYRPDGSTVRITIVATDGASNRGFEPEHEARLLRNSGETVIVIGFGQASRNEMNLMASTPGHVARVSNASDLVRIQQKIDSLICGACFNVQWGVWVRVTTMPGEETSLCSIPACGFVPENSIVEIAPTNGTDDVFASFRPRVAGATVGEDGDGDRIAGPMSFLIDNTDRAAVYVHGSPEAAVMLKFIRAPQQLATQYVPYDSEVNSSLGINVAQCYSASPPEFVVKSNMSGDVSETFDVTPDGDVVLTARLTSCEVGTICIHDDSNASCGGNIACIPIQVSGCPFGNQTASSAPTFAPAMAPVACSSSVRDIRDPSFCEHVVAEKLCCSRDLSFMAKCASSCCAAQCLCRTTVILTSEPTDAPTTSQPSAAPSSRSPTQHGETWPPTNAPSTAPSVSPTTLPSDSPTSAPITSDPTASPTVSPSRSPTVSVSPTRSSTRTPTMQPSNTLDSVAGDDGGNVDDKGNVGSIVTVVVLLLFFLAVGTAFVKVLRQRRKRKQGQRTNTMHLQEGWAGESPETANPYLMPDDVNNYISVSPPDDVNNYISVSPPLTKTTVTETIIDDVLDLLAQLKDDEAGVTYMDVTPGVTPGAQEIYRGLIGAVSDPTDCISSSAGPTLRRLDEMPERQKRPHSSMTAACEERKPRLTTNAWGHV